MLNRLNGNKITWCISLWNTVLGDLIKILLVSKGLSKYFSTELIFYFTVHLLCLSWNICQVVYNSFRREFLSVESQNTGKAEADLNFPYKSLYFKHLMPWSNSTLFYTVEG